MKCFVMAAALLVACSGAYSQVTLKVSSTAWAGLTADERAHIQKLALVDVRPANSFGLIMDTQGVNESSPGTTAGAAIGGSFAEAAYIDRAFKPGNNYSAKNQLALGIMGAVIGAGLDRPPVAQYHFRYALRTADDEIIYRDSVQSDPFRHAAGMCLDIASLTPVPRSLCTQTAAELRKTYFAGDAPVAPAISGSTREPVTTIPAAEPGSRVECKVGNIAPVHTTAEKCAAIEGKVL